MQRCPVQSSVLASVGYSAGESIMDVEFRNGMIYRFFDVPDLLFQELLAAKSKGRFFNCFIRNEFVFQQLSRAKETSAGS